MGKAVALTEDQLLTLAAIKRGESSQDLAA